MDGEDEREREREINLLCQYGSTFLHACLEAFDKVFMNGLQLIQHVIHLEQYTDHMKYHTPGEQSCDMSYNWNRTSDDCSKHVM